MISKIRDLFFGILLGMISGVLPGLHPNILAPISIEIFKNIDIFLVSMIISSNFFEIIPQIVTSIPDSGEIVITQPVNKLVNQGLAIRVVNLFRIGALVSLLLAVIVFPLMVMFMEKIYNSTKMFTGVFLVVISTHLILKGDFKKNLIFFIISGFTGFTVLRMMNLENPLTPMLTGFFGMSQILMNFISKNKKIVLVENKNTKQKNILKSGFSGFLSSTILAFLPGIGPAQASLLSSEVISKNDDQTIMSVAGVNTADIIMSLLAFYTLGKSRSGVIIYTNINNIGLMLLSSVISALVCFFLLGFFGRVLLKNILKINKIIISLPVIFFVLIIVYFLDGFKGIFVLEICTILGLFAKKYKIRLTNLMGCLIFPTILFYGI